jgi:hypothetical protein
MVGKNAIPFLGDFRLKNKEYFDIPLSVVSVRVTISAGGKSPFK